MKKVRIQNGYAEKRINGTQILRCTFIGDAYDLQVLDYGGGALSIGYIKENAKRLSTINKYAEEYGVEFIA